MAERNKGGEEQQGEEEEAEQNFNMDEDRFFYLYFEHRVSEYQMSDSEDEIVN